jgi:quercetin dioxygenase-like cupin family protein
MYATETIDDIMCETKSGNKIYWLVTTDNGAKDFEMRYIEIPPGGQSSNGSHEHEHEVYIVKGKGWIKGDYPDKELLPGMGVFVPGNEQHQWVNQSKTEPFGFICVVPSGAEAESKPPCWK